MSRGFVFRGGSLEVAETLRNVYFGAKQATKKFAVISITARPPLMQQTLGSIVLNKRYFSNPCA